MIDKNKAIKNGIKVIDSREVKNEMFDNLKNNFPQSIKDGKVDLNAIAQLLGLKSQENIGGYELTFTGKGLANALYNGPCEKELKLDEIYSQKTGETPKNIIIKGDNLDALKILKSAYSGKIKMIYIDPPYNTNSDNFIYPDNFREDFKAILREVGLIEIDENGQEVESENLKFFKNITGARTHSGWLAFMLPRLKLARDLLKDDGVIFISIDDNEQANLKLLCDEIFGEDNFVNNFIWLIGKGKKDKNSRTLQQYILCYSKDKNLLNNWIDYRVIKGKLDNPDNDKRGNWFSGSISFSEERSNKNSKKYFTIKSPSGIEWSRQWMVEDKEEMEQLIKDNKIYFGEAPLFNKTPRLKIFENELFEVIPDNILNDLGTSRSAIMEIKNIFGCIVFDTPKPVELIKHLIKISTNANKSIQGVKTPCCQGLQTLENNNNVASAHCVQNTDKTNEEFSKSLKVAEPSEISNEVIDNSEPDIILDFFAGSGTTAQAVMELNSEDNGNREFILVQIEEKIDEKKSKTAFDFCKNELKSVSPVISDITIERVKRATKKLQDKAVGVENLGFKVFALDDKPKIFEKENGGEEKILELIDKRNLNKMDIIINMSLISGKTLDKKIETIFDGKLYKLEDSYYLINCDREILKYLIKTKNEYIFIDAYGDMELEDFLNLGAEFKERLIAVY